MLDSKLERLPHTYKRHVCMLLQLQEGPHGNHLFECMEATRAYVTMNEI